VNESRKLANNIVGDALFPRYNHSIIVPKKISIFQIEMKMYVKYRVFFNRSFAIPKRLMIPGVKNYCIIDINLVY
jgi:hypothetical protein